MLYTRQGFPNRNEETGDFVFTFRYPFLHAAITEPALDTFPGPWFTLKTQLRILTQTELITSVDQMILWGRQKENTTHFQLSMRLLGPHLSSNHSPSNWDCDWTAECQGSLNTGLKIFYSLHYPRVNTLQILNAQKILGSMVSLTLGFRSYNSGRQSRGLDLHVLIALVYIPCVKIWKQSNPVLTLSCHRQVIQVLG